VIYYLQKTVGGTGVDLQKAVWSNLVVEPNADRRLNTALWRAAMGLSSVVGRTVDTDAPSIEAIPIGCSNGRTNGEVEIEAMVGIYHLLEGGLHGHAILILPKHSALNLADLMLENPLGTTVGLGPLERSALGEAGNIAVSYFLNAVAKLTNVPDLLHPSKPTVLEGKLSSILDVVVTPASAVRDDLLVLGTSFRDTSGSVQGFLLIFPDPTMLDLVA
jgi:chemotaxis protein CheY-P-specific phosphatase CheC